MGEFKSASCIGGAGENERTKSGVGAANLGLLLSFQLILWGAQDSCILMPPSSFDVSSLDTHCKPGWLPEDTDSPQGGPKLSPHSRRVRTEGAQAQRSPKLNKQEREVPDGSQEKGKATVKV